MFSGRFGAQNAPPPSQIVSIRTVSRRRTPTGGGRRGLTKGGTRTTEIRRGQGAHPVEGEGVRGRLAVVL
eukprot:8697508-Pyramimonas_sp.AAC.1